MRTDREEGRRLVHGYLGPERVTLFVGANASPD